MRLRDIEWVGLVWVLGLRFLSWGFGFCWRLGRGERERERETGIGIRKGEVWSEALRQEGSVVGDRETEAKLMRSTEDGATGEESVASNGSSSFHPRPLVPRVPGLISEPADEDHSQKRTMVRHERY